MALKYLLEWKINGPCGKECQAVILHNDTKYRGFVKCAVPDCKTYLSSWLFVAMTFPQNHCSSNGKEKVIEIKREIWRRDFADTGES